MKESRSLMNDGRYCVSARFISDDHRWIGSAKLMSFTTMTESLACDASSSDAESIENH